MSEKESFQFSGLAEELIGDLRGVPSRETDNLKRRGTKELSALVQDLIVKFQVGENSPESLIRDKWPEFVGHANASFSNPSTIDQKGKLLVLVSHSVVRGELFHHKARLLAEIKKLPGCAHVKDLHFRAS